MVAAYASTAVTGGLPPDVITGSHWWRWRRHRVACGRPGVHHALHASKLAACQLPVVLRGTAADVQFMVQLVHADAAVDIWDGLWHGV